MWAEDPQGKFTEIQNPINTQKYSHSQIIKYL